MTDSLSPPTRLLVGLNAAHSGASSTYVRLGRVVETAAFSGADHLAFELASEPSHLSAPVCAAIERQGRGAGLLGAMFTPSASSDTLSVIVSVGLQDDSVYMRGLSEADAQAVLRGLRSVASAPAMTSLGAGQLEVRWALTHAVDSSPFGFEDLARKLVPLLILPADASADLVFHTWQLQHAALLDGTSRLARRRFG